MRIFNTGSGNFWQSKIGEQLGKLKKNPQYSKLDKDILLIIEKIGQEALPLCRHFKIWPIIELKRRELIYNWRGRGTISIPFGLGAKISYSPDPIRKSSTVAMALDREIGKQTNVIKKFLKGCFWHLFEVIP